MKEIRVMRAKQDREFDFEHLVVDYLHASIWETTPADVWAISAEYAENYPNEILWYEERDVSEWRVQ